EMPLLERRSKVFRLARSDAVDEVLEVRLTRIVRLLLASQRRPWIVLPAEVHLRLVLADSHPAFGTEDVQTLSFARTAEPVPQIAVKFRAIRVLVGGVLSVRSLLIRRRARFIQPANAVR